MSRTHAKTYNTSSTYFLFLGNGREGAFGWYSYIALYSAKALKLCVRMTFTKHKSHFSPPSAFPLGISSMETFILAIGLKSFSPLGLGNELVIFSKLFRASQKFIHQFFLPFLYFEYSHDDIPKKDHRNEKRYGIV